MKSYIFEIHPKRPISGVLPNHKRIMDPIQLHLSRAEFLRCMQNATLYAIVEGKRVLVTETDWEKAKELFSKKVEFVNKTVHLTDKIPSVDTDKTSETLKVKIVSGSTTEVTANDTSETPTKEDIIDEDNESKSDEKIEAVNDVDEEIDSKPIEENVDKAENDIEEKKETINKNTASNNQKANESNLVKNFNNNKKNKNNGRR